MNKPKFSVALIAKNEELTLPRMIESLSDFKKEVEKYFYLILDQQMIQLK